MKTINAFFAALSAALELTAAEMRNGVNLTDAIAADEFETELRMYTHPGEERDDVRQSAILIAQAGLTAWEVGHVLRQIARGDIRVQEQGADHPDRITDEERQIVAGLRARLEERHGGNNG